MKSEDRLTNTATGARAPSQLPSPADASSLPLILRFRAEIAKDLLRNRRLRVRDVGTYVGFRSLPRFNRVFKQIVGETPEKYRERFQN